MGLDETIPIVRARDGRLPAGRGGESSRRPTSLRRQGGDHGLGAVGLIARPCRLLPARGEDGQDDAAGFAAGFDFRVPLRAEIPQLYLVEPDREPVGNEALVQVCGMRYVRGGRVADEALVG